VGSRRSIAAGPSGVVALDATYAFALYMKSSFAGDCDEQTCSKKDYETGPPLRYPDPANLLPIPVNARTFVHRIVNPALT
jgi:hypothetical protein